MWQHSGLQRKSWLYEQQCCLFETAITACCTSCTYSLDYARNRSAWLFIIPSGYPLHGKAALTTYKSTRSTRAISSSKHRWTTYISGQHQPLATIRLRLETLLTYRFTIILLWTRSAFPIYLFITFCLRGKCYLNVICYASYGAKNNLATF